MKKRIPSSVLYAVGTAFLFTLFFELWRIILLIRLPKSSVVIPKLILLQSFLVGLRFDFAISSYIGMSLFLLFLIPFLNPMKRGSSFAFNRWFVGILAFLTFFMHLADIEFYRMFNSRLNGIALQWMDSPGMMIGMIWETYPVIPYLILFSIVLTLFILTHNSFLRFLRKRQTASSIWSTLIWSPFVFLLFFIGGRGRIEEKAPLNWGVAYFSRYDRANQLALNPTFTFLRDAVYDASAKENTHALMKKIAIPEADSVTRSLLGPSTDETDIKISRFVRSKHQGRTPKNAILIIMESFGATRIGVLDNRFPYRLSPYFDSLASRGLLFTRFYSAGCHTYTGIFCTLSGYPTLLGKSIMKQLTGQSKFYGLASILRDNGYESVFFTTHDPHFDNMQGFLKSNGINRVFSLFDYDSSEKLSTLGVPDHIMFDRAIMELHKLSDQPFFATLLTSSNHGPWIVPDVPFGELPESEPDKQRLDAFKYSDWALGQFIRKIRSDSLLATNTIIMITADNGMLFEPQIDMDLTQYHIPLLILHPDSTIGHRLNMIGSQVDIPATLLGMLDLEYQDLTFGRDLLNPNRPGEEFAQFSEWDHISVVTKDWFHIERLNGPQSLYRVDTLTGRTIGPDVIEIEPEIGNRMQLMGHSIFQTAYFNISRPVPFKYDSLN